MEALMELDQKLAKDEAWTREKAGGQKVPKYGKLLPDHGWIAWNLQDCFSFGALEG